MTALAWNDPARAARFVTLVQAAPPGALIGNLTTRMELAEIAGQSFPLTLNDRSEEGNCYLCRPSAAYIDYALEEIRHFARLPLLQGALAGLIRACGRVVRATGLDHQVQLNNWLFSTNPVPALDAAAAREIRDRLRAAFSDRAIVLRSLNPRADGATMAALEAAGFQLLPARQVWLCDGQALPRLSRDMRRDRALLKDGRFTRATAFSAADYAGAADLYGQLYLQKYTPLNPDYRPLFLQQMHEAGLLQLEGLRDETGDLVAVTGLYESGRTLTQPVVGYNTALPEHFGLYRRMMALSQLQAEAGGRFFNMSAGASQFKRNRMARPVVEYTAVYIRHLPAAQQRAVAVVGAVLRRVGVPLIQRFDL